LRFFDPILLEGILKRPETDEWMKYEHAT
jgi:hypothetical protein